MNQCPHTSLEQELASMPYKGLTVVHLKDDAGRNRFVVQSLIEVVACILFDENNVCMFRETAPKYRRQGLQDNLWKYAALVLGGVYHSEDLTEDGQQMKGTK